MYDFIIQFIMQAMVCTTAFSMGVDVRNIEIVVRLGCPQTLEEFVQEIGRAGRDGQPAKGTCNLIRMNLMCMYFSNTCTLGVLCLMRQINMHCIGARENY